MKKESAISANNILINY